MSGSRPRGEARDALLEAAAAEFAERGYDGLRIEAVARRAGFNKALVYRYFGDKAGLFRATLQRRFQYRSQLLDQLPASFAEILVWWTRQQRSDPHFMRLIQREALQDEGAEPVEAEARRDYYARQVQMLRDLQSAGIVDPDFDPEMLFVALTAVVVFPDTFPQIVRLATGLSHVSDDFDDRWGAFLAQLAGALGPSGERP